MKKTAPTTTNSIAGYLNKIYSDPHYEMGTPIYQRQVREELYDKKIFPYYTSKDQTPPDRAYFVDHIATAKGSSKGELATKFGVAFEKGELEVAKGALNLSRGVSAVMTLGVSELTRPKEADDLNHLIDKGIDRHSEWLGDHYSKDLKDRVTVYVGEEIPKWYAFAKVAGLGSVVQKGIPAIQTLKGWKLLSTKLVGDAAEAYVGSILSGDPNKDAAINAGIYAGTMGAIARPAGRYIGRLFSTLGRKGAAESIDATIAEGEVILKEAKQLPGGKKTSQIIDATSGQKLLNPPNPRNASGAIEAGGQVLAPPPGNADINKPTSFINAANATVLNSMAKDAGHQSFWLAPKEVKQQILKQIGYIADKQASRIANVNKPIIRAQAKVELEQLTQKNKAVVPTIVEAAKASGQAPDKAIADHVADMERSAKANIKSRIQAFHSVGAAGSNSPVFLENLLQVVTSNMPLEGNANKLLAAWEFRSELPKGITALIEGRLKEIKGFENPKLWDGQLKEQNRIMKLMTKTGHTPGTGDERGLFGSHTRTSLQGNPSKWLRILEAESMLVDLKNQTKDPQAKATVDVLMSHLKAIKMKAGKK